MRSPESRLATRARRPEFARSREADFASVCAMPRFSSSTLTLRKTMPASSAPRHTTQSGPRSTRSMSGMPALARARATGRTAGAVRGLAAVRVLGAVRGFAAGRDFGAVRAGAALLALDRADAGFTRVDVRRVAGALAAVAALAPLLDFAAAPDLRRAGA